MRMSIRAVPLLLGSANILTGCALLGLGGGGGGGAVFAAPSETGRLFNNEPLEKSMTYGRTKAGNFHYRYLDGTTAVACKLDGVRGDVFVEYPTREQYLQRAVEAQVPETFAQPAALHVLQGGNDLSLGMVSVPVGGLKPGGPVDKPKGLAFVINIARGFFAKALSFVGLGPEEAGVVAGSPARIRVLETYVRDGDMRCVLTMHTATVADTSSTSFGKSAGGGAVFVPPPAPPPPPTPPAKGGKR